MTDTLIKDYYEDPETPRQFEMRRFYGAFGKWLNEQDVHFFTSHPLVDYSSMQRVLELGCGTGRITLPLQKAVSTATQVVAMDRSLEMLAGLRHRMGDIVPDNLVLHQSSMDDFAGEAEAYDLILFSRLLMHLENWQETLVKVCGWSRQWLLFDLPVRGSLASTGKGILDLFTREKGDGGYQFFHLHQVVTLLDRNDFDVVMCRRLLILPIPVHLRLGNPTLSLGMERLLGGAWMRQRVGSPVYLAARRRTRMTC